MQIALNFIHLALNTVFVVTSRFQSAIFFSNLNFVNTRLQEIS